MIYTDGDIYEGSWKDVSIFIYKSRINDVDLEFKFTPIKMYMLEISMMTNEKEKEDYIS
jgi:hypothetical protein